MTEILGDQGTDTEYLNSSYHFWKMNENTLSSFAQRMSFYIASRLATQSADHDDVSSRILISPFITEWSHMMTEEDEATKIRLDNDKLGVDYLDDLINKIESGEI